MLMFLPGLICDSRIYSDQQAAFPDAMVIDGYGMANSLTEMAGVVLGAADEHGADRLDIFGHSMGGRIALEMFRLAPHRIRRLALVSTGTHPATPAEQERYAQLQRIGHDRGFEALVDTWLPPMMAQCSRDTPAFVTMREMCLSKGQAVFDVQVNALLNRPPFEELLAQVYCPTLVMSGECDTWSPPAQHRQIAANIADAALVVVPGAGHMLPLEAPEAVSVAVAGWLSQPAGS